MKRTTPKTSPPPISIATLNPPTPAFSHAAWSRRILKDMVVPSRLLGQDNDGIAHQVLTYLRRLRHSIPFPADREAVYLECLPKAMREWIKAEYFSRAAQDVRMANLVRMVAGDWVTRPPHTRLAATFDFDTVTQSFWMLLPFDRDTSTILHRHKLVYPKDGADAEKIIRWLEGVNLLEQEIDNYYKKMRALSEAVPSANALREVFPELLHFVKLRAEHTPPMDRNAKARLQHKVDNIFTPSQKDSLVSLLAAATLLPDPDTLTAWGGHSPYNE